MKRLLAVALSISALTIGCRSLPIAVPDLPSDQLLVNQATFEAAVQQRILGSCTKANGQLGIPQTESRGKSVLCDSQ